MYNGNKMKQNMNQTHYMSQVHNVFAAENLHLLYKQTSENMMYLVAIDPLNDFVALVQHSLAVIITDLVLEFVVLNRLLHVECVALQSILGLQTITLFLVFLLVSLRISHHLLYLLLAQTTCKV